MENIFYGKTVDEALENGLKALGITLDEAEWKVLEEPKRMLFISTKAKVLVEKRSSDGERAVKFLDGLFNVLGVTAVSEVVSEDEKIEINISATNNNMIIGRRGEVLEAIQTLAGAVANTGREDYKRVEVDCENYHAQREETLKALALKLAKKAVEKGRKVTLEPMSPYERRIIHATLSDSTEVKTVSDGKGANRHVVIIPNNLKPYEKKERREGDRGERRPRSARPYGKRPYEKKEGEEGATEEGGEQKRERHGRGDRRRGGRDERGGRGDRGQRSGGGSRPRGKKEIHFGTFLGNSGNKGEEAPAPAPTEE